MDWHSESTLLNVPPCHICRIGSQHTGKCVRILQLLEVAARPEDMNIAGFRFHGLRGKPQRWSVRVTGNYRITFGWSGENAVDIDFED
jgi:toxin HigB-1